MARSWLTAHRMSYADAFAVVTAGRHDGELWTGDPELLVLDAHRIPPVVTPVRTVWVNAIQPNGVFTAA